MKETTPAIVHHRFGDRIDPKYVKLLKKLAMEERRLEIAKRRSLVWPYHYASIDGAKADLYDYLMADGIIVIGKVRE